MNTFDQSAALNPAAEDLASKKNANADNPFLNEAIPFSPTARQRAYACFKRFVDIVISLIALLILLLPALIVIIAIRVESKGSPIFKQIRYGRNGRRFTIYKFRTMYQNAPHAVATEDFEDASVHVTKVGHLLRKTSIDELPQLVNVLIGDMSLIGPRPLIVEEERIHLFRLANHIYDLRPGMTGNAQVNGRDDIVFEDKMRRDLEYLHNVSFLMDLKIILKTLTVVFRREGVKY